MSVYPFVVLTCLVARSMFFLREDIVMNNVSLNAPETSVRAEATATTATNPPPSPTATTAQPKPEAVAGRDAHGRFTKGNPGGVGNPFARQVAALRQRLLDRVTPEDLDDIADKFIALAKEGNVQAAKLVLSYAVGKPAPASDLDQLDQHEWDLFKKAPVMMGEMPHLVPCFTSDYMLGCVRATRDTANGELGSKLGRALQNPDEFFPERQADLVMVREPGAGKAPT